MKSSISYDYDLQHIKKIQQKLGPVYTESSIFKAKLKDEKRFFQSCVTFGSNCPSIQMPFSQDYLYRVLYYFILYYSFESGQQRSQYLIDSLTKMIVKYQGDYHAPSSLKSTKIKLSVQQIHGLYFIFLHDLRNSINNDKLFRIINRGIHIDYVFMVVMHTLILHYKQLGIFLHQLGIRVHIFKENQILLDNFQIKLNKISQYVIFRIQKQNLHHDLMTNKSIQLCQSIGTIGDSIINNSRQQSNEKKNFFGFLGTARHVKSFYNSKVSSSKQESQQVNLYQPNDISLTQLSDVIGSIQQIQSPKHNFNKNNLNQSKNGKQQQNKENLRGRKFEPNPQRSLAFQEKSRRVKSQNHCQQQTPFTVEISKIKRSHHNNYHGHQLTDQDFECFENFNSIKYSNKKNELHPFYQPSQHQEIKTVKKQKKRKLSDHSNTSVKSSLGKKLQFVRTINQIYIPTNPRTHQQTPKKITNSTMKTSIQKSYISNKIEREIDVLVPALSVKNQTSVNQHMHTFNTPTSKIKLIKGFFKKYKD